MTSRNVWTRPAGAPAGTVGPDLRGADGWE
ncbi:hypothetical protein SAMN05216275_1067 [Streptosporangium canum]|uniref:Uncharacterized protein n=1 Tax=Streptosporangium canum TaxID=324952 RepID=A0A1I3MTI9_9ACTN|nr:hypothetical protein SAMN05216275_1067 [Streptosporangium canum]